MIQFSRSGPRARTANLTGHGNARGDALASFFDGDLLEPVEVTQQIGPFNGETGIPAAIGQLLVQHQGEEGAEHVAG